MIDKPKDKSGKPSLAMLLSSGIGKKKPPVVDEGQDDTGLEIVAEDLISAVKAGDAASVASALRAAYHSCQSEGNEGYDEED
jgi:hypothetical protein